VVGDVVTGTRGARAIKEQKKKKKGGETTTFLSLGREWSKQALSTNIRDCLIRGETRTKKKELGQGEKKRGE